MCWVPLVFGQCQTSCTQPGPAQSPEADWKGLVAGELCAHDTVELVVRGVHGLVVDLCSWSCELSPKPKLRLYLQGGAQSLRDFDQF